MEEVDEQTAADLQQQVLDDLLQHAARSAPEKGEAKQQRVRTTKPDRLEQLLVLKRPRKF